MIVRDRTECKRREHDSMGQDRFVHDGRQDRTGRDSTWPGHDRTGRDSTSIQYEVKGSGNDGSQQLFSKF